MANRGGSGRRMTRRKREGREGTERMEERGGMRWGAMAAVWATERVWCGVTGSSYDGASVVFLIPPCSVFEI